MSEDLQEPTDDLGMLHVLAHNAHAVLAEYEVCKKCCGDHAKRQSESQQALDAIAYVAESLDYAKSRVMHIPELDSFAEFMCSRYSGAERRVIRESLLRYHSDLQGQIKADPNKRYGQEGVELGIVSGCLLELWNDGTDCFE